MSRSSDTRWLYRQEDTTFRYNRYAVAERSMSYLQRLAARIWKVEGNGRRFPDIAAVNGGVSWCRGFTEIRLCRGHRNILVLLHELTHALGPCVHGPKFIKTYFPLLQRYGGYSRWFLQGVAAGRGIYL
jgi:hypothetical protein